MGRELRDIPTASNRFDKQDACCHLLHSKSCQGLPIEQASGLSGNHVANEEIAATIISVKEQFRGCAVQPSPKSL